MVSLRADLISSYDEVPYESTSFPESHPDRLATLGRLFGLAPASVTHCRVLELGCAAGGNLIPMACQLPDSEFVGVELSRRQVESAQKTIDDLGLHNIRIEHASILEIDDSWGAFDYIISHGVFSWVPVEVQNKILEVSSNNLAPNGISYVSYNTYPGWHMREMIRHMMGYHADQFNNTGQRIRQARALVDFLAGSVQHNDYYGLLVKEELDNIQKCPDWYLFHDHLELDNAPIYFYQFIERAEKHGLQYLAEANFSTMLTSGFAPEIVRTLKEISPNIIRTEQYMDFLRNRFFRETLLCHQALTLKRKLSGENLHGLLVASALKPDADSVNLSPGVRETFHTPAGLAIGTDCALTKASLMALGEHWPRAIDMNTLYQAARQRLTNAQADDATGTGFRQLQNDLLHCYSLNTVEFHTWQAEFTVKVSERPKISNLAAYQAALGHSVTNQRHETGEIDSFGRELARLLDGSCNRNELLKSLGQRIAEGALVVQQDGKPVADPVLVERELQTVLDKNLDYFAKSALLIE